jgi:tetratricopeptide (TPR) repeat protein
MTMGKNEEALKVLDRAVELKPTSSQLLTLRGMVRCNLAQYDGALADTGNAIVLSQRFDWAHLIRSIVFYKQKKYQESYDEAAKAIKLNPENPASYGQRGKAELQLGQTEQAVTDLTKWFEDKSDNGGEAHYYRALAYDKLGKSDLAKTDREQAEKLGYKPDAGE